MVDGLKGGDETVKMGMVQKYRPKNLGMVQKNSKIKWGIVPFYGTIRLYAVNDRGDGDVQAQDISTFISMEAGI